MLCVAALPRDRIVSGSRDKTLKVWDVTGRSRIVPPDVERAYGLGQLRGVPAGRPDVSGSRDKTLKVWGFIKCTADLWAQAILSPEPESGGVMVAFFVGLVGSSRGAAASSRPMLSPRSSCASRPRRSRPAASTCSAVSPGGNSRTACRDTAQGRGCDGRRWWRSDLQITPSSSARRVGSAVPQLGSV